MRKNIENELPKIRVLLRADKPKNAEGNYTLNYIVRFMGKSMKKPTGLYISSKDWNKKKGEVVGTSKEILRIQGILSKKKADFNQYFLNFDATGGTISRKVIDDYFDDHRFDNFPTYFKGVISRRNDLNELTRNKYNICLKVLKEYCKREKISPLRFNDITLSFLQDFDNYLVFFRKLSSDTANNYHKCFKYVLNKAVLDGIINRTPYNGFKPTKTNSRKKVVPLSEEEITAIENVTIPENRLHLENIKDYFIFMLNTGIRYSDLFTLTVNTLKPSNPLDTNFWNQITMLQFQQLKTGGNVIIPLNSVAKRLIQKYVEFYQLEDGFIFPKVTNQVFNRQLKDLADLAEINRGLNCHLARHTFATLLRYKNVSLEDVSELLGHSSIKMTKLYAKSSMKRLTEAVELLEH